jgi:hypothetical protein
MNVGRLTTRPQWGELDDAKQPEHLTCPDLPARRPDNRDVSTRSDRLADLAQISGLATVITPEAVAVTTPL